MDEIINLFNTVVQSPWRYNYLDTLLNSFKEHQAFLSSDSSDLQSILSHINSKLNDHNGRYEGLLILKNILLQCPDDIFSSNSFSWASQSLKAAKSSHHKDKTQENISELAFAVLRVIIESSVHFPEVSKQMLSIIPKLLKDVTRDDYKVTGASLECLHSCMKCYSGTCTSYKGVIEKMLLNLLDCEDEAVVLTASKCFSQLPLICPSSNMKGIPLINGGNVNYSGAWKQIFLKAVGSVHFLLSKLFEDINEVKKASDFMEMLPISFVEENNSVLIKHNLTKRYINLCQYICSMLRAPYSAAKSIPIEEVMRVVCRALSITCMSLKNKVSSGALALFASIPQIHSASFSVLTALIACSKLNLLPYGTLIVKLVMQSLKWTGGDKDWPSGIKKPFSSLRRSAYFCLSTWLHISASASCAEEVADEIITLALLDVVPIKEKLTLTTSDLGKRKHGKYQKRRKSSSTVTAIGECSTLKSLSDNMRCALGNGTANSEISIAALEMMDSLFQSVGPFLKPKLHKAVQDTILPLLIDIQRSYLGPVNCKHGEKDISAEMFVPYSCDAHCRVSLLKLLLTLVLEPHSHKWPSPIGLAAQIFERGQIDPNLEVSSFCKTASRIVERLVHPCGPTLSFPLSLPDMTEPKESIVHVRTTQTEGKEISDVSTQKNLEEIDSVSFEEDPVPKKRKMNGPLTANEHSKNKEVEISAASDVIILSDEEISSSVPNANCQTDELEPSVSMESRTDDLMLVRRVEKSDGNLSIEKKKLNGVPLLTIKNKGVQVGRDCSSEEDSASSPAINSPNRPVLVLKLPLEKSDSLSTKDFSQQFSEEDSVAKKSIKPVEVDITDDYPEKEVIENNLAKETTGKVADSTEVDNDIHEVFVIEDEELEESCDVLKKLYAMDSDDVEPASVRDTKRKEKSQVETLDLVDEIKENNMKKQKEIVEIDVDNLSEGEEMLSTFVDASSESE